MVLAQKFLGAWWGRVRWVRLKWASMVTTVTETFFRQNVERFGPQKLKSCNWLALRAANGLAIPYLAYIEVDIEVLGKVIPKQGVLVVKDPTDPVAIERKQLVPGLLGMNVIKLCYQLWSSNDDLAHGLGPPTQLGWRAVFHALQQEQYVENKQECVLKSIVPYVVPAGSLCFVPSTGCGVISGSEKPFLIEALGADMGGLPGGLLIPGAVMFCNSDHIAVPIVNVSTSPVYIEPHTCLCYPEV